VCNYKGTRFATVSYIFSLISSAPIAIYSTVAISASLENVNVYSAIAISTHVNIIYKWVTKIVKNI